MIRKQCSISVRNTRAIALLTLVLVAAVAARPAQAQTYTVLHAFTAGSDGAVPSPIIRDAQGNLYGTTRFGGIVSCGEDTCGTVFKIDSTGKETVLYSFEGGSNGSDPVAGLVRDAKGNLYGTTQGNGFIGGASVVFKVDPKGQQTVLYLADTLDASSLDSPLALDAHGNLYGMSPYGGDLSCGVDGGCGTLFKITPSGKFTVLHAFTEKEGIQPEGGVVLDAKGNLYGTAIHGGKLKCDYPGWGQPRGAGCGTIYKLDPSGKLTVLHTFTGPVDGSYPLGVIIDSAGNLYGIADSGGDIIKNSNYIYGLGTVFKVDTTGKFSVLFTFTPDTTRNYVYANHLARDSKGNLYGLQQYNNCAKGGGCLFRIDTKGKYTDLYDFEGEGEGSDGFQPIGVVFGSDGDVYGSMFNGGPPETECADDGFTNGCGTVFHLTPLAGPSVGIDTP
jgi:uncharacterized repeat protein (TIGR03803 family)